jgi:hypothetical protein
MHLVNRFLLGFSICGCVLASKGIAQEKATMEKQVLELRTYTLVDEKAEAKLDEYLESALIPALLRQGLGPIGAFDQSPPAAGVDSSEIQVLLLIAGPSVEAIAGAAEKLIGDSDYQSAAADYHNIPAKQPIIKRIRSELLMSFNCWPQVVMPKQKEANSARLFEMRVYESPTEHFGELKVEMFNSGEVPIFLDCKISPVFMGQALIGDMMPNLTYMTVYDDDATRKKCWADFSAHPDWQVLKAVKKYEGTVSKIHKSDWLAKSYSQL